MPCCFQKKYLAILIPAVLLLLWISIRPSNDRDWSQDQAVLPEAVFGPYALTIRNVRNNRYRSVTDYDVILEDRTYDLNDIESLWYITEPFGERKASAHTFLSFGFKGDTYLGISVEIRKEKGETFSALKGLLKNYELMYVIADERDLIGLRANYRKDDVYLYPVKESKDVIRKIFVSMLERANALRKTPEFYNTITNTCTSNVRDHWNRASPGKVPYERGIVLPGYSDELLYNAGLIDTDLTFAEAREHFRINDRALRYADSPDFSVKLREATAR